MSNSWAEGHAARIADEIKRLRGGRSAQWLSDRTAELGHRVSRTAISEIETGKRKSITTAELIVIAASLELPPVQLLFPGLPAALVEYLPGEIVTSIVAVQQFSGELSRSEGVREDTRVLRLSREWDRIRQTLENAATDHAIAALSNDESADQYREAMKRAELHLQKIQKIMRDSDHPYDLGDDGR